MIFGPVAGAFGSCITSRARTGFATFELGLGSAMEKTVRNSPIGRNILMSFTSRYKQLPGLE
jgi:hypothetical protein